MPAVSHTGHTLAAVRTVPMSPGAISHIHNPTALPPHTHRCPRQPVHSPVLSGPAMVPKKKASRWQARARGACPPLFLHAHRWLSVRLPPRGSWGGRGRLECVPLPMLLSFFLTARFPESLCCRRVWGPLIMMSTALHARSAHHVHAYMHHEKAGSRKACMC